MFEVYKTLGAGFLEGVYQECLGIEFQRAGIPFESGRRLSLHYKGEALKQVYVADFVCYDRIIC